MKYIINFAKNNKFLLFIIFYFIYNNKYFFFIDKNNITIYLRKFNHDNLIKYCYLLF